jgi:hypothetical protein
VKGEAQWVGRGGMSVGASQNFPPYVIIRTNVPVRRGEMYASKQGLQIPHLPKQKTN